MSDEVKDPLAQIEEFARRGRAAQQAVDALITPQASAAWQDVQTLVERLHYYVSAYPCARAQFEHQICHRDLSDRREWCHYCLMHVAAQTLAADAQQIAAWKTAALLKPRTWEAIQDRLRAGDTVDALADDYGVPVQWVQFLQYPECDLIARYDAQQIAALRAELVAEQSNNGELRELLVNERAKYHAQLAALQAEQAQWQQKVTRFCDAMAKWSADERGGYDGLIAVACSGWTELAALTAQQEKPQP